jgi:hypothetical protein
MDSRVYKIKEELKLLKNKFPNVTELWEVYINKKTELFEQSLTECENLIYKLNNEKVHDLSEKLILLMYLLNNTT